MEHEEKFPIRFSLSQFVLLLGVEIILIALVFLIGARFGNFIFPERYAEKSSNAVADLAPSNPTKLSDRLADEENPSENPEEVVAEEEPAEEEGEEKIQVNKSLAHLAQDKNMMVRFKSSGNSKFAIEIGEYFDEALAARQITKLKEKGYEAYLVMDRDASGSNSFAVRVGSFGEHQLAERFAAKMSNEMGVELRVVQVN